MTTPVSFEISKLLKEKGFNLRTRKFWYKEKSNSKEYCTTGIEYDSDRDCIWDWNNNSGNGIASPYPNREYKYQYSAPTIAEVVMWLYEKYKIWISVEMTGSKKFYPRGRMIDKNGQHHIGDFKVNGERLICNSPTEAYEAAIEHTIKNLI